MTDLKERAKALLHELETQDNRATRLPIFYEIHSYQWEHKPDGCGDEIAYFSANACEAIYTEKRAMEYVRDHYEGDLESDLERMDLDEIMEELTYDQKYSCSWEASIDPYSPIFLTEKEARHFIKIQGHNLRADPFTYVNCGHWCKDLQLLYDVLKEYVKETE